MKKSVFVTGATNGTGFAIAERFAKEGYDVFIGSRSAENSQAAAQKIADKYGVFAKGYQTEIFNEENVKSIFADIRSMGYLLDTLVLNAANLGIGQTQFREDTHFGYRAGGNYVKLLTVQGVFASVFGSHCHSIHVFKAQKARCF